MSSLPNRLSEGAASLPRSGLSWTRTGAAFLRWTPKASGNRSQDWEGPVPTEGPLRVQQIGLDTAVPGRRRPPSPAAGLLSTPGLSPSGLAVPTLAAGSAHHYTPRQAGQSSKEGPSQAPRSRCWVCSPQAQPEGQVTTLGVTCLLLATWMAAFSCR